jgi:hypothetical protein
MEEGLWAAALNLVVRRFCGCDCTEMVQRQSCGARTRSLACGEKENAVRRSESRSRKAEKSAELLELKRLCSRCVFRTTAKTTAEREQAGTEQDH